MSELKPLIRTLFRATWAFLVVIAVCKILQHNVGVGSAAWVTTSLSIMYGSYLYVQYYRDMPTTTWTLLAESVLILLINWSLGYHMALFFLPLLILRRAVYATVAGLYVEAAGITIAFILSEWRVVSQAAVMPWVQSLEVACIVGLTVVVAQPLMGMARSLKKDKEKLKLKLNWVEESYQQATELAVRDGLTGLYNYRAFQEYVQEMSNKKFAIILIDIDYFKDFNDQYGHSVGDMVLKQIGNVFEENVRRGDRVFRYGGEEFAVLLENADEEVAMVIAERIRTCVANRAIFANGQQIRGITVSIGVSVFDKMQKSTYEFFEQADQALYQAKGKGRNNVVCFYAPSLFKASPYICFHDNFGYNKNMF
jgi:diguanylate cyclase (GGDEF)-like protein